MWLLVFFVLFKFDFVLFYEELFLFLKFFCFLLLFFFIIKCMKVCLLDSLFDIDFLYDGCGCLFLFCWFFEEIVLFFNLCFFCLLVIGINDGRLGILVLFVVCILKIVFVVYFMDFWELVLKVLFCGVDWFNFFLLIGFRDKILGFFVVEMFCLEVLFLGVFMVWLILFIGLVFFFRIGFLCLFFIFVVVLFFFLF